MGGVNAIGWRSVAALFVTVAALASAVAPASAAAGTLSTSAATNVQDQSATLNGSAPGFPSGDYCSFVVAPVNSGPSNISPPFPAQPCAQSYSTSVANPGSDNPYLTPGQSYWYAAVHCSGSVISNGTHYCDHSQYQYPNGWDQVDQCGAMASSQNAPPCPQFTMGLPTGTTEAASQVKGTSATFNGQVQIQDVDPSTVGYFFEYSTDPNLVGATDTTSSPLPNNPSNGVYTVSQQVSGLTAGTKYYYRVVVGTSESDEPPPRNANIVSFTTSGFARTDPATGVTGNGAVINGEVDTADTGLSYSWRYSTSSATTNGELSSGADTAPGGSVPANTDQTVSATLSGLGPNTTYYFQLVTSDPAIYGQVVSFTTLPSSCPAGSTYLGNSVLGSTGFEVSGCWTTAGGVYTGHGPLNLNGVTFSGSSTATVIVDSNANTFKSNGEDIDVGTTRLYAAKEGAISRSISTSTTKGVTSTALDLAGADGSSTLLGLPLGGTLNMTANSNGGASVGISAMGLPSLFGGITAEGVVSVDQDGSVAGVHAQLGDSTIGPLTLPGFTFDGDPQTDTWSGDVNLILPLAKYGFAANVEIKDGKLNGFGGAVSGVEIPIDETGLVISGMHFSTVFSPLTFHGGIDVDLGPKIGDYSALGVSTDFYAGFDQDQTLEGLPGIADGTVLKDVPFTLGMSGTLNMLGFIQLANGQLTYYGVPGYPLVGLQASLAQPLTVSCSGGDFGLVPSLTLAGDAYKTDFNIVGQGGLSIDDCFLGSMNLASAQAAFSNKGMAVCGSFLGNSVGLGADWPTSFSSLNDLINNLNFYSSGCDIGPYESSIFGGVRASAAAVGTLRLPRGLPFAVIKVKGNGGPPLLSINGPRGLKIAMSSVNRLAVARNSYLVIPNSRDDTTYVELTRPAGGTYSVQAESGSASIQSIATAHGQLPPSVRGRVTVRGAERVLTWRARPLAGMRLVFRETGAGGNRVLVSTARPRGRIRFRPLPSISGRRAVIVDVYENGMLRTIIRVASFTGPTITTPRRPSKLTFARHGTALTIQWRGGGPSTDHYLVLVATRDGQRRLFVTSARRLLVPTVSSAAVRVTVTAVNALGVRGLPIERQAPAAHRKHRQHR